MGRGIKILTPNKLLTRLPVLLAHIEAGNNSCKLKDFNLPKDFGNNLKHEIGFIIKQNEFLLVLAIKNEICG